MDEKSPDEEDPAIYNESFNNYSGKIFKVVSILRANFIKSNAGSCSRGVNGIITLLFVLTAIYTTIHKLRLTFEESHTPYEMASHLLVIAWAVQSIVSLIFLVYWQLYGHLKSYARHVIECQHGEGLAHGKQLIKKNLVWFYLIIVLEILVIVLFEIKFFTETTRSLFVEKRARVFHYLELRPLNSLVTLYLYIIWHVSMFIYITYTNTAFLEVSYFNRQIEELDGTKDSIENDLMKKIEIYGRLAGVVRELDRIFRLYAFIMVVIIVPSVIFTLMMLNQRIHSWQDLFLCLPSIGLCAYSFLGVTVAPARLHDEVNRSKSCLLQNASIWFPYRRDVYQIATTLCHHMEQYDLGISIWGFAIVSRPLILATFSVMTMVLSLLIELSPQPSLLEHHHVHVPTHNVIEM